MSNKLITNTFLLITVLLSIFLVTCVKSDQTENPTITKSTETFMGNASSTPISISSLSTPGPKPVSSTPSPKAVPSTPGPKPVSNTPSPKAVPSTPGPNPVSSTPSPKPVSSTPDPKPVPVSVPTIVGTVNFQVDIQQITTASQLGQASMVGPSLINLKDGRYRLYLQARAQTNDKSAEGINILSLISNDGIEWNLEPGIRVKHGTQSDVDFEAGEPGVFLGLDDKYYMAYTGRFMGVNQRGLKQKMHRVVFAVSDDGLTWSKLNKHYSDSQNINDFASSADVHLINGQYVIYYTGQRNIIRASSQDGLKWEREEIAVSIGHDSTMIKYDDTYYMFLMMPEALSYPRNPNTENDILMMLISHNGIDWSENYYQVIMKDSDGNEVKAQDIQDPGAIVFPDGSLRIFLNNRGGKIIYSIKPTGILPKIKIE